MKRDAPDKSPWLLAEAPGRFPGEGQANAHLIAASPDLLSVAQEWVDYFDNLSRFADPNDPLVKARNMYHAERVERTRAAIAKAKGVESK